MEKQIYYLIHFDTRSVNALDLKKYKEEIPAIEERNSEEKLFILINRAKKNYQIICSKCLEFASNIIKSKHNQEPQKTLIEEVRQWEI